MESFMNGKESKPTDRRMTEARIRPIPTGLVRVRQPEELLIRPETDPNQKFLCSIKKKYVGKYLGKVP